MYCCDTIYSLPVNISMLSQVNFDVKKWSSGLIIVGTAWAVRTLWSSWGEMKERQRKRDVLRADRDNKVAALQAHLDKIQVNKEQAKVITDLPLADLISKLKSGLLLVRDVLHAYQLRALEAHSNTNCITNVFEDAEAIAAKLDALQEEDRVGVLFGVPVSIKHNIATKNHVNTFGSLNFYNNISKDDALIIKVLKAEGAIPFVKTNIPQLMMAFDTSNDIYGTTTNPFNKLHTPGGSSGGESALLASHGSPLGFGTDIAGSIRWPASACGICGIKPTSDRISRKGKPLPGQNVIKSTWGPLGREVESLVMAMRVLCSEKVFTEDHQTPPIPFREELYLSKKTLRIGFYIDDGHMPASPPNARAVMLAKELLERKGHHLVPWTPPKVTYACSLMIKGLSGDRGTLMQRAISHDKPADCIKFLFNTYTMGPIQWWLSILWARLQGDPLKANFLRHGRGSSSIPAWFDFVTEVDLYQRQFEAAWMKNQLDAVLCPTFPTPAYKITQKDMIQATNYTSLYNVLDMCAGVVPVTSVNAADVKAAREYKARGLFTDNVKEALQGAEGLPVGVQCVTLRWQEERCLRLMKEIENELKKTWD